MRTVRDRMEKVNWPSRDGTEVTGYLFLPKGRGPFSVIIYLHGGLHASALKDVIPRVGNKVCRSYITKRGYAILMVDYRGSSGYGESYLMLDDWGDEEVNDVLGAVEYLEKTGVAKPNHIFLYGNSRGAFIGLWALERTDKFAAAAFSNGFFNLFDIVTGKIPVPDRRSRDLREAIRKLAGDGEERLLIECWRRSPLFYVERVNGDVLIIGSEADKVVPLGCALEVKTALEAAGKHVALKIFTGAGANHTFIEHGEPVRDALTAWGVILDFFDGRKILETVVTTEQLAMLWKPQI